MFKSIAALALIATLFLIPATFAEDAGKQFEGYVFLFSSKKKQKKLFFCRFVQENG
jgi:hypothetical protein